MWNHEEYYKYNSIDLYFDVIAIIKKIKISIQKRHDAAVFGYETRQDFLDLAKQYSGIMTKGKK